MVWDAEIFPWRGGFLPSYPHSGGNVSEQQDFFRYPATNPSRWPSSSGNSEGSLRVSFTAFSMSLR